MQHTRSTNKVQVISKKARNYKGQTIPVQAWAGPEGSKSLSLPHFMTIGT